ncbi:MAG: response regulator [Janthinobacterium lividum]
MSISQAIAPHLPQLRRFARALTGSQKSGDAYVVETLEAIVADPSNLEAGSDVRCNLYKLFLNLWRSVAVNTLSDPALTSADEIGTTRRLEAISTMPRVALLLTALEGFDIQEVARTIDSTVDEARRLLEAANAEIALQISTDVLIIEDEPLIALDLQNVVEDLGHKVVDVARTHREALKAVQHHRPGLILADIQLADGSSGLEAVNEILGAFEVPVIFITAYPERFLTGAPPEPAFLIAKPFSVETLRAVISQVLFFDRRSHRRSTGSQAAARA